MAPSNKIGISFFSIHDPNSVQQRLEQAVAAFCSICKISAPSTEDLTIARTPLGKPYYPLVPWLHLSISHSGEYWACAIADQVIGFDLQQTEQPRRETPEEMLRRHQKMAHRFFHPLEADFVDLDSANHFLAVWTAREAYVKQIGTGIDQYFSEYCVVPEDHRDWSRISGRSDNVQWTSMNKYFRKGYWDKDYTMCICTDSPCEWIVNVF